MTDPVPPALPPSGWQPPGSSWDGSGTRLCLPAHPASSGHHSSPEGRGMPGKAVRGTAMARGAHQGLGPDSAAPQAAPPEGDSSWGAAQARSAHPACGPAQTTASLRPSLQNLAAFWLRCLRTWKNDGIVLHAEEVHGFCSPRPRYGLKWRHSTSSLKVFVCRMVKIGLFYSRKRPTERGRFQVTRSESSPSQSCTKAIATSSSLLFGDCSLTKCVFSGLIHYIVFCAKVVSSL